MDVLGIAVALVGLVTLLCLLAIVASLYRRCPPNAALIISGMPVDAKFGHVQDGLRILLAGEAGFVLPMVQQASYISLAAMPVHFISTKRVSTADDEKVSYDALVNVQVENNLGAIVLAAQTFLGKSDSDIKEIVSDRAHSCMDKVIQESTFARLTANNDSLQEKVEADLAESLKEFGLTVLSVTVKRLQK